MRVMVVPDAEAVGRHAAALVADMVAGHAAAGRGTVLGVAAGATPVGLYRQLQAHVATGLDFARVAAFALDEYLGLPPEHPALFARCFQAHLPPCALTVIASRPAGDLAAYCAGYEQAIAAAGGIDLQLLGIGGNGHIGFNEPGSSLGGRTRPVALSAETRAANAGAFAPGEAVPEAAITMGTGTILEARRILLLATGAAKAAAVAAAVEGPLTAGLPASALQLHADATLLLDEAAASRLTRRAYYDAEAALPRRLDS